MSALWHKSVSEGLCAWCPYEVRHQEKHLVLASEERIICTKHCSRRKLLPVSENMYHLMTS